MIIPFPDYRAISARLVRCDKYFNPVIIKIGETVDYPGVDDVTDKCAWKDAERMLHGRGLRLEDIGNGYKVIDALYKGNIHQGGDVMIKPIRSVVRWIKRRMLAIEFFLLRKILGTSHHCHNSDPL